MVKGMIGRLAVAYAVATARHGQLSFPLHLRSALPFSTLPDGAGRKRIVFLGTPQVAALVLQDLLQAAAAPCSNFEVAAVVSRPSSRQWLERERQAAATAGTAAAPSAIPSSQPGTSPEDPPHDGVTAQQQQQQQLRQQQKQQPHLVLGRLPNWARHGPSEVEKLASSSGMPSERILCPLSAKEPDFLEAMYRLRPDLAITVAYGGMLPQAFLDIPRYGTLNIHPSLLPRYRGPAPVARALQDGCTVSGVSLVFTVLKCDAGPVLEQQKVPIDPDIQAPELMVHMFRLGSQMLLRQLPGLLSGAVTAADAAVQDDAAVSYAPKVVKQDGVLDFRLPARRCHDQVRAMAGWPGTKASLLVEDRATGVLQPIEVKVLRTRVVAPDLASPHQATTSASAVATATATAGAGFAGSSAPPSPLPPGTSAQCLYTSAGELLVPCGDGNMLSILEVARRRAGNTASGSPGCPPRSFLTAKDFMDGLGKRRLFLPLPDPASA
ncbi:hypothetical protein PLESTB_001052700 [Pleodorina starrii]|uniref:methionyl-tRNA formyltransferase n=1 Tax=Pleodorina starrii TaxID=330485 RepID=A0A9W6F4C7_9CHLO|nr:hypothetical protein PLESTB_001052700 [Pleodorina starrii]